MSLPISILKRRIADSDKPRSQRTNAIRELAQLHAKSALMPLITALESETDNLVLKEIINALVILKNTRATFPLLKALRKNPEEDVSYTILDAIVQLRDDRVVEKLTAYISLRSSKNIKIYADRVLLKIKMRIPRDSYPHAGYAYHFTDLANLGSILESNCLLSRERAEANSLIAVQGGYEKIIERKPELKKYVRFYLRPNAPMLYRVEGIKQKPSEHIANFYGKKGTYPHVPIPVYFIFNFEDVFLNVPNSNIGLTTGNASASNTQTSFQDKINPIEFIAQQIKWDAIYQSPGPQGSNDKLQAEMLIRDKIDIKLCSEIVFRSKAEKGLAETLFPAIKQFNLRVDESCFHLVNLYIAEVKFAEAQRSIQLEAINFNSHYRIQVILRHKLNLRAYFYDSFVKQKNIYSVDMSDLPNGEYEIDIYVINDENEGYLVYRGQSEFI
jgi:hypothetical protein